MSNDYRFLRESDCIFHEYCDHLCAVLWSGNECCFVTLSKGKGIGGYNMVRAFVLSLLTDNNDEANRILFPKEARVDSLKMKYLAFRPKTNNPPDENHPMRNIKGLFVLPNVHFGPFKTAGSAALPETIYSKFGDIQGLTVFHTSVTHGENFASRQSNALVCKQIEEDMSQFLFKTPKISKFHRTLHGQTKVLGFVTEKTPYIFATRRFSNR